jgi:hypothetical protein
VLEVDARERGWQLALVARGRADEAARLPERPVGQRDRLCAAGHDQSETLGTVTACLDAYARVSTVRVVARSERVRTAA